MSLPPPRGAPPGSDAGSRSGGGGPLGRGRPPSGVDAVGALEHYEASLSSLRAAMAEVESSPSYLMLTDADLGPETARRYGRAASDAAELWTLLEAAGSLLGAARNHLATRGSRGGAEVELGRLIEDRWYSLALDGRAAQMYSASSLLAEVRRRYDAVRSAVADVDHLWVTILPRVDAARATLDRLEAEVAELGVPEPLVGRARALAEDLAERLVADPVSVHLEDGTNLDRQVAEAAKQVATLRTKRDDLDDDLASTEELLASLRVLRARADAARAEALAKIAVPEGLVRVPAPAILDGPDGLGPRLDRLFDDAVGGGWTHRRRLLDGWLGSARRLEAQLLRAAGTNRGPIENRDELRGRLQAYVAKMAAMGRAEDLSLVELADRARNLLYNAPTDLDEAEAAIAELAARLRP